jgi:E3 ubiquitin-protein ligase CCNP1IP1
MSSPFVESSYRYYLQVAIRIQQSLWNNHLTHISHIFCQKCAHELGLTSSNEICRDCPACGSRLQNTDDCVLTNLNPPEDYKTSILSGFAPSVVLDCASRALAFYAYQSSQEMYSTVSTYTTENLTTCRQYAHHFNSNLSDKYNRKLSHLQNSLLQANSDIEQLTEALKGTRLFSHIATKLNCSSKTK